MVPVTVWEHYCSHAVTGTLKGEILLNCKYIKNIMGIFVVTCMLLLPTQVQAAQAGSKNFISGSQEVVNTNLPKGARTSTTVQAPLFNSSIDTVYSLSSLENIIKSNMYNRVTSFSVDYVGDTSNLKSNITDIIDDILNQDDYLKYSYTGYEFSYGGYEDDIPINFSFNYLTTKSEEDFVDSKVSSILGEIINSSMSDDQKEKNIHDYIVKNVQYDTSYENYSAYDALSEGKTVCQGYALLAYKMLNDAGIETKIISGTANNGYETESHAWNLVKLNGNWYHLDCTWDDPVPDVKGRVLYDYYNLTDDQISKDHSWDHSAYPSATTIYTGSSEDTPTETSVTGVKLSSESLVLKVGQTSALKAAVSPIDADNKNLSWQSSDSSVAAVDSSGNITALDEGSAVISVKTEDGGYTDSCEINVVSGDGTSIDFSSYKKWGDTVTVANDKLWNIKFTKPFDASTVNSDNVLVYEEYNNLLYPIKDVSITYNDENNIIYVQPTKGYVSGKTYRLVITQNVLSKDGQVIPKPIVLTFKIA